MAPTLLADLTTGLALAGAASTIEWWRLGVLVPISLLLFAGGMAINARVDLAQDREQRPERPLPSGQVSTRTASLLAALGLAGGPLMAFLATGSPSLTGGVLVLTALILTYHSPVRRHPLLGPVVLGSIRGGNVLLPALWIQGFSVGLWGLPHAWLYLAYVTGASLVAHQEDRPKGSAWVPAGQILTGLACLAALGWVVSLGLREDRWLPALVAGALVAAEFLPLYLRVPRVSMDVEALAGRLLGRMPVLLTLVCLGAGQTAAAAVCLGCFLLVRVLVRFLPPT